MQAPITIRLVNSLKPADKPYEVFDHGGKDPIKGFLLRVEPSGVMTYYLAYRTKEGKRRRYRVGRHGNLTVGQARDIAGEKAGQAAAGIDIHGERVEERQKDKRDREEADKAKTRTLEGFLEHKYGPWVESHRKRGDETIRRIKANFAHLLPRPMQEISAWIIEKWRSEQAKAGKSKATINRDLTALRAVLAKAVEWETIDLHPLAKVKPMKIDSRKKVRFLSEEEEKRLRDGLDAREERIRAERDSGNEWRRVRGYKELPSLRNRAFADYLKPMALLTINTGLRRGELFALAWGNVDLRSKVLTVEGEDAKSGSTRHIPLNQEALAVLTGWNEQLTGSGLVFPGRKGRMDNIGSSWPNVLEEAGIKDFRWHDLRHHFASKLVMAGVPLNTVRELLGHEDIKTTLRYAHLAPDHKAEAVEKLANGGGNG